MKITGVESLHCDAGWRNFSFLKITTDDGITGYSEYNESYGSRGLSGVIDRLTEYLIGKDPLPYERIQAELYARTRQAPGGVNQQAIAAIENALLDVKGKALGVPVYELLGGPVRDRLRLYWSHCGTTRVSSPQFIEGPAVKSLDDIEKLGREAVDRGFTALKTNIILFDDGPRVHMPGFSRDGRPPELNPERKVIEGLRELIGAFNEGSGGKAEILLDLNYNFKIEGFLQVTRALDDLGLLWFEMDLYDPAGLALIRRSINTPIASCESLYGGRGFRDYFEHRAMDVPIIDAIWNGVAQSVKIAATAETYEMNVAPHNFYGHLSTLMSAHFCAAIPNFRIMEIDIDDVPWKDELVTPVPVIEDGHLLLPSGPGWGAEVNEEVIRAHPPKSRSGEKSRGY